MILTAYETIGQMHDQANLMTCDLKGVACCSKTDNCCNDTSRLFNWKPGYLISVINRDGSNRLLPLKLDNVVSNSTSTNSSDSADQPSVPSSNGFGTAAIVVVVLLSSLLFLAIAGLVYIWRCYTSERALRLNSSEALKQTQYQMLKLQEHPEMYAGQTTGRVASVPQELSSETSVYEVPDRAAW
jgi:hypothetical protein